MKKKNDFLLRRTIIKTHLGSYILLRMNRCHNKKTVFKLPTSQSWLFNKT